MRICIFCGASSSLDSSVMLEIKEVMHFFYHHDIELIYGGAAIGIMGALANELMILGGKARGVIPRQLLKKEVAHAGLTELLVVKDMHERKKMMYDMADAFLIFPGGMGTMDELFEILTWKQLGLHHKPIALLNINHYYDSLLKFLSHAVEKGLVKPEDRELLFASHKWDDIWAYYQDALRGK